MNNKRRSRLKMAGAMLNNALVVLEDIYNEENDCLYNIPENLQCGYRYELIEDAVDVLGDLNDCVVDAIEKIDSLIG